MSSKDVGGTPEQRRISRRKMLAGSGAVVAGAWAAPVIVDSVLNPAFAAGTPAPGATCRLEYKWGPSGACPTSPTASSGAVCGDAGTNTECSSTFAGHVIISSCTPGSSITFDLVPGSSCTFISAIAQSSSNTCGTATLSNNDKTVNLVPAATKSFGNGNVIRLEITC